MLARKCRRANVDAHMSGRKCESAKVVRAYVIAQKSPTRVSELFREQEEPGGRTRGALWNHAMKQSLK